MNSAPRNNRAVICSTLMSLMFAMLMLASCGQNQSQESTTVAQAPSPEQCLHATFAGDALQRNSDIRTFAGDSLWEYIDGGAEIYHQYDFEIVATADYIYGSEEITADIYRFAESDGAFGLYASLRPENPATDHLGVQGYVSASATTFVKGRYVVQLTAFDATDSATAGLSLLADELESCLPGTTAPPATFTMLPLDSAIANSEKLFALSFQGRAFLTDFYTRDYTLGGDTVTVFLSTESAADKFRQWKAAVTADEELATSVSDLPFSEGQAVVTETYYGPMLFGVKGTHLIGMINYSAKQVPFLRAWMDSSE